MLLGPAAARGHPLLGPGLAGLGLDALPPECRRPELLDRVVCCILLVHEASTGGSRWGPYLDLLPAPDSAVSWPPEEAARRLRGTPLAGAVARARAELAAIHRAALAEGLCLSLPAAFPAEVHTLPALEWAFSVFWSRALRATAESAGEELVPLVDAMNHRPGALTRFERSAEAVGVVSDCGLRPGDWAELNYGPKGNGELLLYFGFCLVPNLSDTLTLELDPALFNQANGDPVRVQLWRAPEDGPTWAALPVPVLDAARALVGGSEVEPEAVYGDRLSEPVDLTDPVSAYLGSQPAELGRVRGAENERRAVGGLRRVLGLQLEELRECRGRQEPEGRRAELVRVYCEGMEQLVGQALAACDVMLDAMAGSPSV